jgi:hypothetical protein
MPERGRNLNLVSKGKQGNEKTLNNLIGLLDQLDGHRLPYTLVPVFYSA